MTALSANFTLAEMTRSETALRKGIANVPTATHIGHLATLCETLLEPIRTLVGQPVRILSGYRCPELNTTVGGAKHSAHLDGRAADFEVGTMNLVTLFDLIRATDLPYDQVIQECGPTGWIHIAIAANGTAPRRQALTATGKPGAWVYVLV